MIAKFYANDFLMFAEVIQQKGFTAAADANNLTAAAVSKRISQLERNLGVTLLHRTTRTFTLTEEGRILFDYAQQLKFDMMKAKELMLDDHDEIKGTIRILGVGLFMSYIIVPLAHEFMCQHPGVSFVLDSIDIADEFDVCYGDYDLMFNTPTFVSSDSAVNYGHYTSLGIRERFLLIASPAYIKKNGTPKKLSDLSKHQCIFYQYPFLSGLHQWEFTHNGRSKSVPITPVIETNQSQLLIDFVVRDLGIALLPEDSVEEGLRENKLVQVLPGYTSSPVPMGYSHSYDKAFIPRRLQLFIDLVKTTLITG